jgi:hypothetical protein
MSKLIYLERRAYRRSEEAPQARTAEEDKQEQTRMKEIHDEAAEIDAATDEVLEHIDTVLALGIGQAATAGAA